MTIQNRNHSQLEINNLETLTVTEAITQAAKAYNEYKSQKEYVQNLERATSWFAAGRLSETYSLSGSIEHCQAVTNRWDIDSMQSPTPFASQSECLTAEQARLASLRSKVETYFGDVKNKTSTNRAASVQEKNALLQNIISSTADQLRERETQRMLRSSTFSETVETINENFERKKPIHAVNIPGISRSQPPNAKKRFAYANFANPRVVHRTIHKLTQQFPMLSRDVILEKLLDHVSKDLPETIELNTLGKK